MIILRSLAVLSIAVISVSGLSACSSNVADSSSHNMENTGVYSDSDVMFMQMMIEHHQQALEISHLAVQRAYNPEVKRLAESIVDAQSNEITMLEAWINASGMKGMRMVSSSDAVDEGMLSHEQIVALENLAGVDFDRVYLEDMIQHHKGALVMVGRVADSNNSNIKKYVTDVVALQSDEIAQMQVLLGE